MNWGINENASEKEKLKAEVNDYFRGLNAVGKIDWIAYCELYDVCMPILEIWYDRMKAESAESEGENKKEKHTCISCRFYRYDRRTWPCDDCLDYDRWKEVEE